MKKFIAILMSLMLFTMPMSVMASEVTIQIDGQTITPTDVEPEIVDSRVFVPLTFVSENLGYDTDYIEDYHIATIGDDLAHLIGSSYVVTSDGTKLDIGVDSYIKDNRTMVSSRLISEALGYTVQWDDTTKTVDIITK